MNMHITFEGKKQVNASFNGHTIKTDQPLQAGGDNSAPSPYELFLASLGTCAGIYVKFFSDQRGISTEGISLEQSFDFGPTGITKINIEIKLPATFPEKYRDAVIAAADQCKVKKTLAHPPAMEIFASVVN